MRDLKITTDHDEIRKWAEKYKGMPQVIDDPAALGDRPGIRVDFPGHIDDIALPESKVRDISWEAFFNKFDELGLAFAYVERINLEDPEHVFSSYRFIKRRDWMEDRELMDEFLSENLMREFMDYKERGRPD